MRTVDVGQVLDEGRWSGYQKLLIFGTALTIIVDGVDNQLLPNALNSMIADWSAAAVPLTRDSFSGALFWGPIGMLVGGLFGGMLGDRIGRRSALLLSVISFAALTIAVAAVNSILMLGVLRFLAGIGLGGAMPNAAALSSEYVPKRKRSFAVTLTIVCIPLGGFLAASLAELIVPRFGWRALFLVGGSIPIVLALILLKVLPESPRFLATRRERWPELSALLRRLGHKVPADVTFMEAGSGKKEQPLQAIRELFAPARRRDTLGLFGAFFFCLLANYIGIQLLVVMLNGAGFVNAFGELRNWNLGGVGGALLGAVMILRLGSRVTMLGMSAAAIVCAIILTTMQVDPKDTVTLSIMLVLLGGLMNAVQTTMYSLAANVYPTAIRGTGIGTAVAVGRIGNAMAGYVGNFALNKGGTPAYFGSFAITMTLTFISLALIRRHIERTPPKDRGPSAQPRDLVLESRDR